MFRENLTTYIQQILQEIRSRLQREVGWPLHPLTDTCTYETYFSDKDKTPIISATVTRTQPDRRSPRPTWRHLVGGSDLAEGERPEMPRDVRLVQKRAGAERGAQKRRRQRPSRAPTHVASHEFSEVAAPCQRDVTLAREDSVPRGPRHVFVRCTCTPVRVRRILAVARIRSVQRRKGWCTWFYQQICVLNET